ncbi:MAG: pyridoxamine kinase [Lachnospiraceae bacterium]
MYKKILTVQDISCVGTCSMTVALPILSVCGLETAILPSAVLSTHTGISKACTFRDLTQDMPNILAHWVENRICFDAFYSGYLGSAEQVAYVIDVFQQAGTSESIKIVDPVMGDHGKLYAGFDLSFVESIKTLCQAADYILPNLTEACLMTGVEYCEYYDAHYIDQLILQLKKVTDATIILTGVSYCENQTGIVVATKEETYYYSHFKFPKSYHGTGDIFAAAFSGALLQGLSAYEAVKIAANYTLACIEYTDSDQSPSYGVKFEPVLGRLIEMIKGENVCY